MSDDWQNRLMSERMELDAEFGETLAASEFTQQQWNLVMTAVDFDVENPETPERARLIAVTDKLPSIMGELDRVGQAGAMGMGGPGGMDGPDRSRGASGGLLGSIKSVLGVGGGGDGGDEDEERLAAAEELAQEYADGLQQKLEQNGKWEQIVSAANEG